MGWDRYAKPQRLCSAGTRSLGDCLVSLDPEADDYLTRPFQPRELLARIRTVLRRMPMASRRPAISSGLAVAHPVRLGRSLLDLASGRSAVAEDGAEVPLTSMELELLRTMLRHPHIAMSRELAQALAAKSGARGIDALSMCLRRRLEADPARPSVLRTVRGQGHLLVSGAPIGALRQLRPLIGQPATLLRPARPMFRLRGAGSAGSRQSET